MSNFISSNLRGEGGVLILPLLISLFIHFIILLFIKTDFIELKSFEYKKDEKYSVKLLISSKTGEKKEEKKSIKSHIKEDNNHNYLKKIEREIKEKIITHSKLLKKKIIKKLTDLKSEINSETKIKKKKVEKKILVKKRVKKTYKLTRTKSLKLNNKKRKKSIQKSISKIRGNGNPKKSSNLKISDRMLRIPKPKYPIFSRKKLEEGEVVVLIIFGRNGKYKKSRIQKSSGFKRLDRSALKAAQKVRIINRTNLNFQLLNLEKEIKFIFKLN